MPHNVLYDTSLLPAIKEGYPQLRYRGLNEPAGRRTLRVG